MPQYKVNHSLDLLATFPILTVLQIAVSLSPLTPPRRPNPAPIPFPAPPSCPFS